MESLSVRLHAYKLILEKIEREYGIAMKIMELFIKSVLIPLEFVGEKHLMVISILELTRFMCSSRTREEKY